MSITADTVNRSADSSLLAPRWVRVLRSAVLIVTGLVITFSATMHEQFQFDLAVVAIALLALAAVHLIEWGARRGRPGAPIPLMLGIVAVIAAALSFALSSELALAMVLAGWALVSGLLEFLGMTVVPGSRQDAAVVGAVGVALALVVLLSRGDLVAVIGFFGGYAIITGVFLGIAALDTRRGAATGTDAAPAPGAAFGDASAHSS